MACCKEANRPALCSKCHENRELRRSRGGERPAPVRVPPRARRLYAPPNAIRDQRANMSRYVVDKLHYVRLNNIMRS
jgi:hypothetical protein